MLATETRRAVDVDMIMRRLRAGLACDADMAERNRAGYRAALAENNQARMAIYRELFDQYVAAHDAALYALTGAFRARAAYVDNDVPLAREV
jgi:hypothetical protein